jgi:hypothetical protein
MAARVQPRRHVVRGALRLVVGAEHGDGQTSAEQRFDVAQGVERGALHEGVVASCAAGASRVRGAFALEGLRVVNIVNIVTVVVVEFVDAVRANESGAGRLRARPAGLSLPPVLQRPPVFDDQSARQSVP